MMIHSFSATQMTLFSVCLEVQRPDRRPTDVKNKLFNDIKGLLTNTTLREQPINQRITYGYPFSFALDES